MFVFHKMPIDAAALTLLSINFILRGKKKEFKCSIYSLVTSANFIASKIKLKE